MCCAAESTAIPVGRLKYPSPPFRLSMRRARDCTAGAFETLANKSLAAAIAKSCAKQDQRRRRGKLRQGGKPRVANACGLTYKTPVPELSRFFGIITGD